jgi:phage terminase large subunit GpA-like protein
MRTDYNLSVSEWADKYRVLPQSTTAESGKWNTDRTPYLREIMDCLSPKSSPQKIVFMKGAQIGGTEAGLNWLGYIIHYAPGPTLFVNPSEATSRRNSKMRVSPMIESMPILKNKITAPTSRDTGNTILHKEFRGGSLVMTGANAPSGLRSVPIRYLFLDEVDEFPKDCGNEGDPVDLAIERTATFANRKIFMVSTPTLKDASRIEQAFLEGDQRFYEVPCPKCGHYQMLKWAGVVFNHKRLTEACYRCENCGALWHEWQKPELLRRGHWVARNPLAKIASFHLSSLYSPWVSWTEIAREFLSVKDIPDRLQVWTNTKLAETWENLAGAAIDPTSIMLRAEDFGNTLPDGVVCLTAGIDVQDNRLEVEIVGWGRDEESWSIDYQIIYGDPSTPELWGTLDELLMRRYKHARQIKDIGVLAACIDSGGHYTDHVINYCFERRRFHIWAIKGRGGHGNPVWPAQASESFKTRRPVYVISVNSAKDILFQRLDITDTSAGRWHFPTGRDTSWYEQLTNEVVFKKKYKGVFYREWQLKKEGVRVEALDCRVYAYAALRGLIWTCKYNLNAEADKIATYPLRENVALARTTETDTCSESKTDTETGTETESSLDSETGTSSDTKIESRTGTRTETETGAKTDFITGLASHPAQSQTDNNNNPHRTRRVRSKGIVL